MRAVSKARSRSKAQGSSLIDANRAALATFTLVVWEFFSYFGMRALLVLYLTEALHWSDAKAYILYGAYLSLVFLTPLIGGWLADRFLGFKQAVILGAVFIIAGHFVLGVFGYQGIYFGLALITVGVGFFKTNAICLVSDCYQLFPERQAGAYVWYYVAANLGATIGPIVCAVVARYFAWRWGFGMAGVGMLLGLALFLSQGKYLKAAGKEKVRLNVRQYTLSLALLVLSIFAVMVVLIQGWSLWVLILAGLMAFPYLVTIYRQSTQLVKKRLRLVFILTLACTAFWAFDQQGGSSISLFILRDVVRKIGDWQIPAAWFQSINPAVILLAGPLIAFCWRWLGRRNYHLSSALKVMLGVLLLTVGFSFLAMGASMEGAHTSMFWPVAGLVLIGVAELFIDPVMLGEINRDAPPSSRGFLTGVYYLFVGSYANYASVQVAKLSLIFSHQFQQARVSGYSHEFYFITLSGLILSVFLMILIWKTKKQVNLC